MLTPAATAARMASDPEWWNVPSPRFWNRCCSDTNGAIPIQLAPSPPIWQSPVMAPTRSAGIKAASAWQPIPAPTSEPSGTTVERLCGQPEQK